MRANGRHFLFSMRVAALAASFMLGCDGGGAPADAAAGVTVCTLTGGSATSCSDAPPELSVELCRCGSRFHWDGTSCVATAACRCLSGCERLFETDQACEAAYVTCRADAGP